VSTSTTCVPCSQYCLTRWFMKKDLPLPLGPNTNLFLLVVMPFFIGRSEISRCSGFPVSLSTILMPKGEGELR